MFDPFKEYFGFIAVLISVGGSVYAWLTSRSRGNEKHLQETDETLADHEKRIMKLEGEFQHLPSKEGQHRLELSMSELIGDMKQMTEALNGTRNTVARMESVLMERGDK